MIAFADIAPDPKATWAPPASYSFVNDLAWIPVSDTELLQSAHFLPLALFSTGASVEVGAVLHAALRDRALVDPQGRWRERYMPIALRTLPFRLAADGSRTLQITSDLSRGADAFPVFEAPDEFTKAVKAIHVLLQRAEEGKARLSQAAERLILADLVAPIDTASLGLGTDLPGKLLTLLPERLSSLGRERAAALVGSNLLAIDLAMALNFSRRAFAKPVAVVTAADESRSIRRERDPVLHPMNELPLELDNSELFSFDMLKTR